MVDIPVLLTFLLSLLTLSIYLLPRWHRKRTITIPIINYDISVVGLLRQIVLRLLLAFVYSALVLIILREVYITRSCETSESLNILTIAIQSRALRILTNVGVPIWADAETLADYLYTTHALPKWKSYHTFSTLWVNDQGLDYIQQLLSHEKHQLWTKWFPNKKTLRIGFIGTFQAYLELVFWEEQLGDDNISRFLVTNNPDFEFPRVHYHEIFPLHFQEPRGYPTLKSISTTTTNTNNNNNINNNNNNNDHNQHHDTEQTTLESTFAKVGVPHHAHQISLRSWGDLSHDSESRSLGSRQQCLSNLFQLRFLSIQFTDAMIEELKIIGYKS